MHSRDEQKADLVLPLASLTAAALTAAVASLTLPASLPGLSLFLCAGGIGAAAFLGRPGRLSTRTMVLAAFAGLLALTAVMRAALWLITWNVLLASLLACWSVAGASTWQDLFRGLLAPVGRLPFVLRAIAGTAGRGRFDRKALPSLIRGATLAGGLLFVFGSLFVSADAAFGRIVKSLIPDVDLDGLVVMRIAIFGIVLWGTVALILGGPRFGRPFPVRLWDGLVAAIAPPDNGLRRSVVALRPVEWIPALGLLLCLFAFFVAVQLTVLFGGHRHVLTTAGLSYAEYARQGFGQLITASALSLALLAAANAFFDRPEKRHSLTLGGLLSGISVLTLVILASALQRLSLYEEAFGFTRLRLSGHAAIFWIAGVFFVVALASAARKLELLPLSIVSLSVMVTLAFTAWNPDARIAERSVHRFRATGKLDSRYLSTLSSDAVPALKTLPPDLRRPLVETITGRLDPDESWTSWNLGRHRARRAAGIP